jgi:hypothetical protein
MEKPLVVRAHHLGCLAHFAAFGGKHATLPILLAALKANPDRVLRIVAGPDDICLPCPHWNGAECVREAGMEPKNRSKDERFLVALGLADGAEMSARDALKLLAARVTSDNLKVLCADCVPEQCAPAISRLKSGEV